MKAAVIERQGGLENIVYRDWPDPTPGPDDVVVRVRACGLNHLDIFVRRGMPGFPVPMPFISGGDVAGEVAALGSAVADWRIGERVIVNPQTDGGMMGEEIPGGFAELVRVPAKNLLRLPAPIGFATGAAIPINYGTAQRMLTTHGRIQAGESILIVGASGGVGIACLQIAKLHGLRTIVVAGSAEKCMRLKALGADAMIDMSAGDFSRAAWALTGKQGVDVVVNNTGGDTWVPSLRTLKKGGRLITCGATAGYDPKEDLRFIWVRELKVLGSNSYTQDDIATALAAVAAGKLEPVVTERLPLARLADAEAMMEARAFFGKIVLEP